MEKKGKKWLIFLTCSDSWKIQLRISNVVVLSHVWLFVTPWTAAHQVSLSFAISQSLLKFMYIELVMLSNHLIPFFSCTESFPALGLFYLNINTKEINPEYSMEGLLLRLKFKYFGHLLGTANTLEKTLMVGKIEGRRRRGQQRMR